MSNKLIEIQNINNCNQIYKIQIELDNTQESLIKTIGLIMDRGEKLDELVKKSEDLSKASKDFYNKSKKLNCCGLF
jgi:synaptobrevin family protein YKT6